MAPRELLVALLRDKKDLSILQNQGWYRIPVQHQPKRWPPEYLAFYQPKAFEPDAFCIRYFGRVAGIETVARRELFPTELESANADKQYYKLKVEDLVQRSEPIPSRFPRRVVFVPTTLEKFRRARELNDLFDDSPLEDALWEALKRSEIPAERQFEIPVQDRYYQLDFAVFCNEGQIDAEADGDTYHARVDRIDIDNKRNNALTAAGWEVLRFNGKQIHEDDARYCIGYIQRTINNLGGLKADGVVPRKFYPIDDAQQLSFF